ncbi:DDE-type integrase/transposase/recombinase [Paraburkholderia aromaticivorans]|uniref:DDE-type integrase/transposase/recombinase n=1 Tax=Paraburkholderia aromaticivorans TaxID=2026199 RepID=UPI001F0E5D2F|nr:DDE-type integrase/transposase/recombinase [Paraburkholderia aromaticivorans]
MERDPVPTPPASHHVPDGRADDELRVAAVREQLEIGVKATETGAVRVRTVVHEDVRSVPVSLRSQKVTVERTAVNRVVERKDEPRQEGDTLNNIVEQDHRAIKRRTRPMLGFKDFCCARILLSGIEIMHMIAKGQMKGAGKLKRSAARQIYSLAM